MAEAPLMNHEAIEERGNDVNPRIPVQIETRSRTQQRTQEREREESRKRRREAEERENDNMAFNNRRGTPGHGQDRRRYRRRRAMDNLQLPIQDETNDDEMETNNRFDREEVHIQTLREMHNLCEQMQNMQIQWHQERQVWREERNRLLNQRETQLNQQRNLNQERIMG